MFARTFYLFQIDVGSYQFSAMLMLYEPLAEPMLRQSVLSKRLRTLIRVPLSRPYDRRGRDVAKAQVVLSSESIDANRESSENRTRHEKQDLWDTGKHTATEIKVLGSFVPPFLMLASLLTGMDSAHSVTWARPWVRGIPAGSRARQPA
jgi:hypothetical protein